MQVVEDRKAPSFNATPKGGLPSSSISGHGALPSSGGAGGTASTPGTSGSFCHKHGEGEPKAANTNRNISSDAAAPPP